MKRWRTILSIVAVLLVVAGGFVTWRLWPRKRVTVTDSRNIRTPESAAQVRDVLWDAPESADEILRLTEGSADYALDADGRRLVFVRGDGAAADLYVRERSGQQWGPAKPLDVVNTDDGDFDVSLSPDGGVLVFSSDRPGAVGGFDLFISRYSKGAWGKPAPIDSANSAYDEIGAAVSAHGTRLVFASNRPDEPTPIDDESGRSTATAPALEAGDYNLFSVDVLSNAPATPIASAISRDDELAAAFSPVGDFVYFASDRTGGAGGFDLYRMRILPDGFGAVEHLDNTINTAADELDPALGLSGFRLTYRTANADEGVPRLLQSTSREVFRDVSWERGTIDWAALWRQIAPNLMLALLALILTLLFLAMMRDYRDRKISLMARCLLVSLLAHLVLMLLFNVVKVSTTIASAIGGRDRIRVSLMPEATAGEIGEQIRGDFVDVQTVAADVGDMQQAALESQPIETQENVEIAPQAEAAPIDAPVDAKLTHVDTNDAPTDVAQPQVQMASALPDLSDSFTARVSDNVELPAPAPAETQAEAPAPSGVALVGEKALDSPIADAQTPTTQPAAAMSIEIGVQASAAAVPNDDGATPVSIDAGDAKANDPSHAAPVAIAADVSMPNDLLPIDIALPGSDVPSAPSGQSDGGVTVASVNVTGPEQAALEMPTESEGGTLVELAVVGKSSVKDDDQRTPVAAGEKVADADADPMPVAPGPDAPVTDDAFPGIELAIDLPGDRADRTEDSPSPSADGEFASVAMPDDPAFTSALPSVTEALAYSQKGGIALATIGPESDTSWVTKGAKSASREAAADESAASPKSTNAEVGNDSAVPFVRIALGVGVPVAPPRPTGIRRGMIGRIVGTVEDAGMGRGLGGARVRLVLPDEQSISARTDEFGRYEIQVPPVPDHFALSASRRGFVPESRNIDAEDVRGHTLTVNFALSKQTELIIALEDEPDVHHLGNDRFEGRINSQFQKHAAGRTFRAAFYVSRDQMPPNYTRAELVFMVKGVQCPHQVRINGRLLRERLADSPADGSFGEYRAAFDAGWLLEGKNAFKIRASVCRGDLDDFEFVNVQIRLRP